MKKKLNVTPKPEEIVWFTGRTKSLNEYFIGLPFMFEEEKIMVLITETGYLRTLSSTQIYNIKRLSFIPPTVISSNVPHKFTNGIWVSGKTNDTNEIFIGRTSNRNDIELILLVTETGLRRSLPWDGALKNLKQLFISNGSTSIETAPSTRALNDKPSISDKLIAAITLNSIDNQN